MINLWTSWAESSKTLTMSTNCTVRALNVILFCNKQFCRTPPSCTNLSTDGEFQVLKYRFKEGLHYPNSKRQIINLLKQLRTIHNQGYMFMETYELSMWFLTMYGWLILTLLGLLMNITRMTTIKTFWKIYIPSTFPFSKRAEVHDLYAVQQISDMISAIMARIWTF